MPISLLPICGFGGRYLDSVSSRYIRYRRIVFSGQPERADCRGFCGEKMIGYGSWIVKREWVGKDGGTSQYLSFTDDKRCGDSPGCGTIAPFAVKTTMECKKKKSLPCFNLQGDGDAFRIRRRFRRWVLVFCRRGNDRADVVECQIKSDGRGWSSACSSSSRFCWPPGASSARSSRCGGCSQGPGARSKNPS